MGCGGCRQTARMIPNTVPVAWPSTLRNPVHLPLASGTHMGQLGECAKCSSKADQNLFRAKNALQQLHLGPNLETASVLIPPAWILSRYPRGCRSERL